MTTLAAAIGGGGGLLAALDNLRYSGGSSNGALSKIQSFQNSRISKGRLGYPKKLRSLNFGISGNSRALMRQTLSEGTALSGAVFGAGLSATSTIEAAQKNILALRSKFRPDQLAPSLRPQAEEAEKTARGSKVDVKA